MTDAQYTPEEVDRLISHLVEGSIDRTDMERLEALLQTKPDVRQRYYRLMHVHTCLNWRLNGGVRDLSDPEIDSALLFEVAEEQAQLALENTQAEPDWIAQLGSQGLRPANASMDKDAVTARHLFSLTGYLLGNALTSRLAYKAYAVAAALVLAVILFFVFNDGDSAETEPLAGNISDPGTQSDPNEFWSEDVVAVLTGERDALWEYRPSGDINAGQRFVLTRGFAEITTAYGAVAILEAPCAVEFTNNKNALRLHAGRLVGLCHTESSKGFVIETDHGEIKDLGTEFGVQVSDSGFEVNIFSGEVQINAPGLQPRMLKTGQSAEVTTGSDSRELVVGEIAGENQSGFTRRLPRNGALAEVNLLGVDGFEANVLPQGFWDGAKPYTHRWSSLNGIDGSDIPTALLGGDLVQMPGDVRSKVTPDGVNLRVQVDPVQPVDVYLLLSERQKPTEWLVRDYEQTPWGIGVAFSAWRSDAYSIWKRKLHVDNTAIVGEDVDSSMYILLLVPHDPAGAD